MEIKPTKQAFREITVIGLEDFKRYYERVDFVFVAVRDFQLIEDSIKSVLGH